jgi:DNA-binding SARP family transcriptional activator
VRLLICGRISIEHEGGVVAESAFPGRLGRRLWAYLVLQRRRPVSRGELVDALWGDASPEAADASLNALVSRVRTAIAPLGPGCAELRAATGTYSLHLAADAFVDRERAWSAINHVQALQREGRLADAWAEAIIANEIAARGFLAGEDAPWIEAERRTLRDIELQALDAVCEAELAQRRPLEAERVARRLVTVDPLRESGYRHLMRAARDAGNAAQAVAIMDECRAALAAVSARPSAVTERLFRELVH